MSKPTMSTTVSTVESVAYPHVIVLFGATGDLARRKLLPGLLRLTESGLLGAARIVGTLDVPTGGTEDREHHHQPARHLGERVGGIERPEQPRSARGLLVELLQCRRVGPSHRRGTVAPAPPYFCP